MAPNSQSLTLTSKVGILKSLISRCGVTVGYDPANAPATAAPIEFDAIWDTGATNSLITQKVVDACGLKPISLVQVHGVHGPQISEVFLAHLYLPNMVAFPNVRVTKGSLAGGPDILIGMDIITTGDFAITNKDGKTIMSFRVPTQKHIDFVKEHNAATALEQQRNAGAGNRWYQQHGRPKKHK